MTFDPPESQSHTNAFANDILAGIMSNTPEEAEEFECDVAPKELPPGYQLGGYELIREIGSGGFGVTYLAHERYLERRVVIKENFPNSLCYRQSETMNVMLHTPSEDSKGYQWAKENFMREARILSSLDHPHIAKVYSYFEAHQTAYYVTEYIEGNSLGDVVADYARCRKPIPQSALLGLMVRLLDALHYLHIRKLLHRDIKPDNILITPEGLPVLIDFGAVRESYGDLTPSYINSAGFTPAEQITEGGNMGPWTDIYALGATLYYVLTGKCLPEALKREYYDEAETLSGNPRLLSLYAPAILQSIDKACSFSIENRYQDAASWIADLHESRLQSSTPEQIRKATLPHA